MKHEEKTLFRRGLGQLGWLANITKPEASFHYCTLSTVQSKPHVANFKKLEKAICDLQVHNSTMQINKIDLKSVKLTVYTDTSFANLADGSS